MALIDSAGYGAVVMSAGKEGRRLHVLTLALDAGSGYGGAEKLAYEFALRLDRERFTSCLCTIRATLPHAREASARDAVELAEQGVRTLALNQRGPFLITPRAWSRLYAVLAREPIDVLHAHMPRASVPGALMARAARVPVIISHEHGSALEGKAMRRLLDRQVVARLSTTMVAVSDWDRHNLIRLEGIDPDRIVVVPNGIVPPVASTNDLGPELSRPPGGALIGAVGRLYPEKGYADLIRAVALIRRQSRPVRCVIAGVGPEEDRLRELIASLGLADVTLLGRRSDVHEVISMLDVAVLPSRREGSPLAMLEYMAAAAPIVATSVGGVPELIDDGVHGLLVEPGEPAALAAGIQRLIDDPALAQRLGRAARDRQRQNYDLGVVVGRLEELYRRCYEEASATRVHR
jgi:glycosyltransferase involved in cell wall biosynthesis